MLLNFILYFALASALTIAATVVLGLVRARIWIGLPFGIVSLALAAVATATLTHDQVTSALGALVSLGLSLLLRLKLRQWSFMAAQALTTMSLACAAYLVYAAYLTVWLLLAYNPLWFLSSLGLFILEAGALTMAVTYGFEMLDVLSRRENPLPTPSIQRFPRVVLQVPTYNEPLEVVRPTLESLAALDYPDYDVQVIDNNTKDPGVWRPLEALCNELGPKFQFIHLEEWPGFKAGALNEGTRRLPDDVEVLAIIDADYVVEPAFLKDTMPHFDDPAVAFVQTPQNYRDWEDDPYLRGLFFSYRYFFDVTMPSRAHRTAIIFCGTMGLVRRAHLVEAGGWSETCITEDAEASLRILGLGYGGVFVPQAYGAGLMPLDFSGLKKQRYRWALGGVQILRMHFRELLPGFKHKLRLTRAQRVHYLLGSLQWFGDFLAAAFTILLVLTALGIAISHRLPVRQLTGALVLVPLLFLLSGLLRAAWAIKVIEGCTWGDAVRVLRIWFALSWVVTLACIAGLVRQSATFIRTPKSKEGRATILRALASTKTETGLGLAAVAAAVAMLAVAHGLPFVLLGLMLLFEASVYFSAAWAAAAAEGIQLTPFREIYRRSAQNTGDRPVFARPAVAISTGAAIGAGAALAAALLAASPGPGTPMPSGPTFPGGSGGPPFNQNVLGTSTSPSPTGTEASPTVSPSSLTSPSPASSASPSARPPASPAPSPVPSARSSP